MLLLGSANTITIDGTTIFPDHNDPDQFWYLPGPVGLARRDKDRRADFTFIKYKPAAVTGGAKGGGFLTFSVNLRLDPELERRILSRLAAIAKGRPKLTCAPFDEGTVKCIALNLEGAGGTSAAKAPEGSFRAVEQILGASVPSLHGDNTAAFSLTLSQEGAIILEKSFKEGTTPVGVLYDLKFTGMRPALDIKITADFERIYSHFSAGLEAQVYFAKVGIDAGFEKLVQEGAIKIEVINYTGEADLKEKEKWAKDFFKDKLLADWFKPTLTPGKLAGGMAKPESLDSVMKRGNALRPPVPEPPPKPSPTETPAPPKKPEKDPLVTKAKPPGVKPLPVKPKAKGESPASGTGFPPTSSPSVPVAAAGLKIPSSQMNPASAISSGGGFPFVASFKLKFIKQEERKKVTLEYHSSEATQRNYAPQGFFGLLVTDLDRDRHFVEVDLDDPFFRVFRVTSDAPIDFAKIGLNSAHLSLDYGDPADPSSHKHYDFVFDKDHPEEKKFEFFMNKDYDTDYSYQVQYHFYPGSGWEGEKFSYELPEKKSEDRTLLVNPFEDMGFLEVRVFPNRIDSKIIESSDVHLSYKYEDWSREKTFIITAESEPQFWRLRIKDPEARAYTYRFVHHLKDGSTRETEPVITRSSAIPVDDPFEGALDIELVPLFDPSQVKMVFFDFEYDDPDNNYKREERIRFTKDSVDSVKLYVSLMDPQKRTFKYRLTFVGTDNKMRRGPFVETEETLIGISE